MGDFFCGWRRKIGVVTLLMACLFAAGWVRSNTRFDRVMISCSGLRCIFVSGSQKFQFVFHQRVETVFLYRSNGGLAPVGEERTQHDVINERGFENLSRNGKVDFYQHRGRLLEVSQSDNGPKVNIWLTPYWSIVIPLTLLSTYLLLSKPRKANPMKSLEPVVVEGA